MFSLFRILLFIIYILEHLFGSFDNEAIYSVNTPLPVELKPCRLVYEAYFQPLDISRAVY